MSKTLSRMRQEGHERKGTVEGVDITASLGAEFAKRLKVLKMSRRRFAEQSGISRQTMHKIEHEPNHVATDVTYQMLDDSLGWVRGTAKGLAEGSIVSVIRQRVIENINSMSLTELERTVRLMEAEALGTNPDVLATSDEVIARALALIRQVRDQDTGDGTGEPSGQRRTTQRNICSAPDHRDHGE